MQKKQQKKKTKKKKKQIHQIFLRAHWYGQAMTLTDVPSYWVGCILQYWLFNTLWESLFRYSFRPRE